MLPFQLDFRFSASESREVFLNGNVYDFSVDYNSANKSDIKTFTSIQ